MVASSDRSLLRISAALFAVTTLLAVGTAQATAQDLPPGAPTEDQLDAALATHHPDVLDRGLPDGHEVWFIVDAEANILETGAEEADDLQAKLRERYPEITTEAWFEMDHITVNGREVLILWMIPIPPD